MNGAERGLRLHNRAPRPRSRGCRSDIAAVVPLGRRAVSHGRRIADEQPEIVGEIHALDGPDGERLALQQARVLSEVTAWLNRNRHDHGHDRAA